MEFIVLSFWNNNIVAKMNIEDNLSFPVTIIHCSLERPTLTFNSGDIIILRNGVIHHKGCKTQAITFKYFNDELQKAPFLRIIELENKLKETYENIEVIKLQLDEVIKDEELYKSFYEHFNAYGGIRDCVQSKIR